MSYSQSSFKDTNKYLNQMNNKNERNFNVCEKDLLITQLKAQIFELEQNEKNFGLLTQKFRNLQNEVYQINDEKLSLENELKKNCDTYQIQVSELKQDIQNLNYTLSEKIAINKKLLNDNNQLYRALEQKNLDLVDNKNNIDNISGNLEHVKNDKLSLENKITQLIEHNNNLQTKLEKFQLDNQDKTKETMEKESKIRQLEAERLKLMSRIEESSFEKQNLFSKMRLQEDNLNSNQKQSHELVKENVTLQNYITERDLQIEKLHTEIKHLNNNLSNEKFQREDCNSTIEQMDKIIQEKTNEVRVNLKEVENCRNYIERLTSNLNLSNAQIERLKSHIIMITEQNEVLSDQIKALSEQDEMLYRKMNRKEKIYSMINESRLKIDNSLTSLQNLSKLNKSYYDINSNNNKESNINNVNNNTAGSGNFNYNDLNNNSSSYVGFNKNQKQSFSVNRNNDTRGDTRENNFDFSNRTVDRSGNKLNLNSASSYREDENNNLSNLSSLTQNILSNRHASKDKNMKKTNNYEYPNTTNNINNNLKNNLNMSYNNSITNLSPQSYKPQNDEGKDNNNLNMNSSGYSNKEGLATNFTNSNTNKKNFTHA